ncbi:hypothetical protein D3C77_598790 [compost metagenome]
MLTGRGQRQAAELPQVVFTAQCCQPGLADNDEVRCQRHHGFRCYLLIGIEASAVFDTGLLQRGLGFGTTPHDQRRHAGTVENKHRLWPFQCRHRCQRRR